MHGFCNKNNEVLLQAGYDVIVISPPGGAAHNFLMAYSDRAIHILLHCNYTSILHCFRFYELFVFAGIDVIAIMSLGGASGNFRLWIVKGRPQLYIHVQLTLFVYLERFRHYSTFFYLAVISLLGTKFWGFLGKMSAKTSNERKTLAGRALSYAKLRLLSHCA